MAGIGSKIKEAAMKAARDKVSGGKKSNKHSGRSESGVDKAMKAFKKHLK